MINAIIIEDEKLIAKDLEFKIDQISADIKIIEVLPSVKTANKWFLENAEPDLIFADIQLSDGTSFEIFQRYQLNCPVIFTTAYDEYAIQAFKVNGIDYLLKPIDSQDLKRAIEKARVIIESKSAYPQDLKSILENLVNKDAVPGKKYKEKFIVQFRKQWLAIDIQQIACFVRESINYIYTFTGEKYVLDFSTLEEIEELVDPSKYYRANRQSIVHIDAIQSVKPHENSKLTLTLKPPLKMEQDISREKAPVFKKWLDR